MAVRERTSGTTELPAVNIQFVFGELGDSETPGMKLRTTTTLFCSICWWCLCSLAFFTEGWTSLHIQTSTKMKTVPFPRQKTPLNMYFCLEGEDKGMNRI